MAHIWIRSDGVWGARIIEEEEIALKLPLLNAADGVASSVSPTPRIKRFRGAEGQEEWFLIAPPRSTLINGKLEALGIRLLRDRDEVQIRGSELVFFCTEQLARVGSFSGPQAVHCGRCHDAIKPGSLAVRCPNPACGIWYHQREDRPCWTYGESCSLCPQPTALSGKFSWTPDHQEVA